jgi:large subunit ribosomal protein L4e
MTEVDVLSIDGNRKGGMELPGIFTESVRPELILRAVIAENTMRLQPQGHYPLAGMQTSATYYGAMNSYRTGRHMGIAIRPREKLGGGVQGRVRRIPSSVTGKRAHPHVVEKRIVERINREEYRRALESAVAATVSKETMKPLVVSNELESIKRTKDMIRAIRAVKLGGELDSVRPRTRKGLSRGSSRRGYSKRVLIVLSRECEAVRAARNIAGVDVCAVGRISANLLAPGGRPGRAAIWSEAAVSAVQGAIDRIRIGG